MVMGTAASRDGMDLETAADILYAIGSPETYQFLVVDRGWSASRFERWYGETLALLLLDPVSPGTSVGETTGSRRAEGGEAAKRGASEDG